MEPSLLLCPFLPILESGLESLTPTHFFFSVRQMPSVWVAVVVTWVCPLETVDGEFPFLSSPCFSDTPSPPPTNVPQPLCCVATASLGGRAGFNLGDIL